MHGANDGSVVYTCVVGHVIPASLLESETEVKLLDEGAHLRLCRKHGASIGVTRYPESASKSPQDP